MIEAVSDFAVAWRISRGRFDESVLDLTDEQLNWRLQPGCLTLGEAALHVAGVETWFISQLLGRKTSADEERLMKCATEGVVNDNAFPFSAVEITAARVKDALVGSRELVASAIESPSEELLEKQIRSALGPIIDGRGALARLAFHPGYHQGQAHLIRSAPGFPG